MEVISSDTTDEASVSGSEIFSDMLRHMIFNNIRMLNRKFKEDYGDLIFCCDGYNNWRKKVFEHYKANRRKQREENPQNIDWQSLFLNTLYPI